MHTIELQGETNPMLYRRGKRNEVRVVFLSRQVFCLAFHRTLDLPL